MKVGIAGLGLIGGSFAKAFSEAGHTVYAREIDRSVMGFAELSEAVSGELTHENVSECDLVLVALYVRPAIAFLEEFGPYFGKKPVVIDCCGTKRTIYAAGLKLAEKHGFLYVGGHPMAGAQYSGFKYARSNLFHNAPMVIIPEDHDDIALLERIKELLSPAGFKQITVTTAERHDEIIAFTSQLAHVVSNAYVKTPTVRSHKGFSAGSYKDLTRVAWLNPDMWTELFFENSDYLATELRLLIERLNEYLAALETGDRETMRALLEEGKKRKEEVDGP